MYVMSLFQTCWSTIYHFVYSSIVRGALHSEMGFCPPKNYLDDGTDRDTAIILMFLPIMLFHNAKNFVQLCLRWTLITCMLKLFHNFLHVYADGELAFVSRYMVMSVCAGLSVSPRTKQWVAGRYIYSYLPIWKSFLLQAIASYQSGSLMAWAYKTTPATTI